MSQDVYQPCSCGSGKKYKFCCMPVARVIEQAEAALEKQRPQEALQLIESAQKSRKYSPYLALLHASALDRCGRAEEALQVLEAAIAQYGEHPYLLLQVLSHTVRGDARNPAVADLVDSIAQHALLAAAANDQRPIPTICTIVAGFQARRGNWISAAAYSAVAATYATSREEAAHALQAMQQAQQHVRPSVAAELTDLRPLLPAEDPELAEAVETATRLMLFACFTAAAQTLAEAVEKKPNDFNLLANLAWLYALAGRIEEAFSAADRLIEVARTDEQQVTARLYRQLLRYGQRQDWDELPHELLLIRDTAVFLSRLDEWNRALRLPTRQPGGEPAEESTVRSYLLLTEAVEEKPSGDPRTLFLERPELYAGLLWVFPPADVGGLFAGSEHEAPEWLREKQHSIALVCLRDEQHLSQIVDGLREVGRGCLAGDAPDAEKAGEEGKQPHDVSETVGQLKRLLTRLDTVFGFVHRPRETARLDVLPSPVALDAQQLEQYRAAYERTVQQWRETPLPILGNRTPAEVQRESPDAPELRAAAYLAYELLPPAPSRAELFGLIGVSELPAVAIGSDQELVARLSGPTRFAATLVDLNTLTDQQLLELGDEPSRFRFFHWELPAAIVARPGIRERHANVVAFLCARLAHNAAGRGLIDQARRWLQDAQAASEQAFQAAVSSAGSADELAGVVRTVLDVCAMCLGLLLQRPHQEREQVVAFLQWVRDRFVIKVPELGTALGQYLAAYGAPDLASLLTPSREAATAGPTGSVSPTSGLWTPDAPASGSGGKIWVPGQD